MRLRFFGGFVPSHAGEPLAIRGRGQIALLLRLAIDAGTTVGYRALAEDVWPDDAPRDPRASLQSLASRLRRSLPEGALAAVPGGYRLEVPRDDVDITHFQDLVQRARRTADPREAGRIASIALELWTGDPWVPDDGFDWVVRDLLEDRAHAERLAWGTGPALAPATGAAPAAPATDHLPPVPAALASLVGRGVELELIDDRLATERLVTLIGPGGAGKTTLAMETARRRPDAVFVELAPAPAGEVWAAVAGAVGRSIRLSDATPAALGPREHAVAALAGRAVLVVFDNCEHLVGEAARVAHELLRSAPGVRILATSREPLGVPGEAFVDVGPLPEHDAAELFVRRLLAAGGEPGDDLEPVRRIVRHLDGLPFAIELAAARGRTLTVPEIEEGLADRFRLLDAGPRTAEPRHRTLRALIDWSWETLGEDEREALCVMAVFPDGIRTADADAVARRFGIGADAFERLVDRSLLRRADRRFRMLETVREYGMDRLRADGREDTIRAGAAAVLADLAAAQDRLLRGPDVRQGLAWFDANEENVTSALRTCAEATELTGVGVRLTRAVLWAWMMRERYEELAEATAVFAPHAAALSSEPDVVVAAVALLRRFAASDVPAPEELRSAIAQARAVVAAAAAHPSELSAAAGPLLQACIEAAGSAEPFAAVPASVIHMPDPPEAPRWTRALLSALRAAAAQNNGDVQTLGTQSERALDLFRESGDVWGIAMTSQMRSEWLMLQGRLEEALAVADASTVGLRGLSAPWDVIQQQHLGVAVLLRLGRIDEARARVVEIDASAAADGSARSLLQANLIGAATEIVSGDAAAALARLDALDAAPAAGVPEQLTAWCDAKRALALTKLGRRDEARDALRTALARSHHSGDQPIMADAVLSLAAWLAAGGRDDDARRALAHSTALRGTADTTDPLYRDLSTRLGAAPEPGGSGTEPDLDLLARLLD